LERKQLEIFYHKKSCYDIDLFLRLRKVPEVVVYCRCPLRNLEVWNAMDVV